MIPSDHPFFFLTSLFEKEGSVFTFSRYIYIQDQLFDNREIFSLRGNDISEERVNLEIDLLNAHQELALHSLVKIKNKTFHIPMIDFSIDNMDRTNGTALYSRMNLFLPKKVLLNLAIYKSGRSFHAYSTALLEPKEWKDFMGRLLLINPKHGQELVDSRWIGHRLIGGFGSLRWSNNSNQYLALPARIAFP